MNILIISPFSPYPLSQGGKIRIFNIIKNLSKSNSITLAAIVNDKLHSQSEPLQQFCEKIIFVERPPKLWRDIFNFIFGKDPFNYVRYFSVGMKRELERLVKLKTFDIIQIEFAMMWQYVDIFNGIPIVLDAHNIEFEIVRQIKNTYRNPLRKLFYIIEEKKFREKEERAWRECSLCFTVSDKERNIISSYLGNPNKVFTIPNGVDLERFKYYPKTNMSKQLLFLGSMDYRPNLDSALYFLEEIFPIIHSKIKDVKLDIVGRELWRIQNHSSIKGVELHENVPEVIPYFRKADVLIVPLRYGAGTRIKILEAMAAGTPLVTTSKGCEGVGVTNGEHLLVADSPEEFASAVQRVIEDDNLRNSMTQNAREFVERNYSWEMLVEEMEGFYHRI